MITSVNNNHRIAFKDEMHSIGVAFSGLPIDDGELHRFRVEGDKANSINGWYVLHGGEIPAGAFGCWKRGINQTWCAISKSTMNDKQREKHERELEAAKNKRDYEQRERQRNAAIKSGNLWTQASPFVDIKHPYLIAKGIQPTNIKQLNNTLLVPMQNALSELVNLQRITVDGQKRFMYGGTVKSCYCAIGEPIENAFLCEGYATGVTIHQATNLPVIIAFNAGNLIPVIKSLAITHPTLNLIIAADNDHKNEVNVGLEKGKLASSAFGFILEYPVFDSEDLGSDFNDLANSKGIASVASQLSKYSNEVLSCQKV